MAFYGKCRFCGENGHSVSLCSHNNKMALIRDMRQEIEHFSSRAEIRTYLYRLPSMHFDILASELHLPSGMPRFMVLKTVENHYVSQLSVRLSRMNRYELDVEENASTYVAPHSLFQRMFDGIYSVGVATYRMVVRPTGWTNVPRDIETGAIRPPSRKWSIAPTLKQVISFGKEECPICLECKSSNVMITPACLCRNSFCHDCFTKYLLKHKNAEPSCPICRKIFKQVDVYDTQLFNRYVHSFTNI